MIIFLVLSVCGKFLSAAGERGGGDLDVASITSVSHPSILPFCRHTDQRGNTSVWSAAVPLLHKSGEHKHRSAAPVGNPVGTQSGGDFNTSQVWSAPLHLGPFQKTLWLDFPSDPRQCRFTSLLLTRTETSACLSINVSAATRCPSWAAEPPKLPAAPDHPDWSAETHPTTKLLWAAGPTQSAAECLLAGVQYGTTRYGVMQYDMIRYSTIWHTKVWYYMVCTMRCEAIRYDTIPYGRVRYGMAWIRYIWNSSVPNHIALHDAIRHHTIRYDYDMTQYHIRWYGMLWHSTKQHDTTHNDIIWRDMLRSGMVRNNKVRWWHNTIPHKTLMWILKLVPPAGGCFVCNWRLGAHGHKWVDEEKQTHSPGSPADTTWRSCSWSWSHGWVGSAASWPPPWPRRGSDPAAYCSSQPRPVPGPGPGASQAPPPPAGGAQTEKRFISQADCDTQPQPWGQHT